VQYRTLLLLAGSVAASANTYTSLVCGSGSNNIPDGTGMLSCILTVNDAGSIASGNAVTVSLLGLQHEASGDLIVTLTHFTDSSQTSMYGSPQYVFYRIGKMSADPNDFGYSAEFGDPGGTGDNYDFGSAFPGGLWATAAALGAANFIPGRGQGFINGYATTGQFSSAATTFSAMFAGQPLAGVWRLDIADVAAGPTLGSTGSLLQWQLALVNGPPPPASLSIAKTHTGNFTQGQQNATYTVTVSNAANAGPTSGTVTVTETVPSGLMFVSMAGTGWTCPGTAANNCTRSDALNGGASYPSITVTVNVAANASSPHVNMVSVSGGGSATASITDATTILTASVSAKTGIFRNNGVWILDVNGDGVVNYANLPPDRVFQYTATAGDIQVLGDWNGDGKTKTGIFRNGLWILDANGNGVVDNVNQPGGDLVFQYTATPGDIPVVGDWNGDGRTKTGVFRNNGVWILDVNGDGVINYANLGVDKVFQYTATAGDVPVIGDWNGDGKSKTGIFRNNGVWILDVNGDGVINYANLGVDKVFQYTATAGDVPVIGDWNGDGKSKTGIFRGGVWILDVNGDGVINYANLGVDKVFQYTATPGDTPVVGDWNGDGKAKTGIFRNNGVWILDVNGDGVVNYSNLGVDRVFQYTGTPGDKPLVGRW
jgi:uncharacterized repeat protein (TIGR01451 family)